MDQYLDMGRYILEHGLYKPDRTGTGTISIFGYQNRYNLRLGFPLVTTKKLHIKSIVHELLWFLKGDTNIKYLNENGVTIWDEWADENGDLGPIYGAQWRSWNKYDEHGNPAGVVDQISEVIEKIKKTPWDRGLVVSAWNVGDLDKMALRPCHCLFQFYVNEGTLSCSLYQRSADYFLGVPFNIASYALLTHMIAHVTGLEPGWFIHSFGDAHIYVNHLNQVKTQLERHPFPLPILRIKRKVDNIFDFEYDDFEFFGYKHYPPIKGEVAV